MLFEFQPYVLACDSYVTRLSLVCSFTMNLINPAIVTGLKIPMLKKTNYGFHLENRCCNLNVDVPNEMHIAHTFLVRVT